MRISVFVVSFLALVLCRQILPQAGPAQHGQLTVIIEGMENDRGKVWVALSDSQRDFETTGQAYRVATLDILEKKASVTFDDLRPGEYALKVFHDENENGELDSNFLGIPSENYGFSNDARGSFGPASWDDAKFMLKLPADTINIHID